MIHVDKYSLFIGWGKKRNPPLGEYVFKHHVEIHFTFLPKAYWS